MCVYQRLTLSVRYGLLVLKVYVMVEKMKHSSIVKLHDFVWRFRLNRRMYTELTMVGDCMADCCVVVWLRGYILLSG